MLILGEEKSLIGGTQRENRKNEHNSRIIDELHSREVPDASGRVLQLEHAVIEGVRVGFVLPVLVQLVLRRAIQSAANG